MVRVFLSWWGRQLLDVLPARLRSTRPAHEVGDAVLLSLVEAGPGSRAVLDATRRRQRRTVPLGRFGVDEAGLGALRAALGGARGRVLLLLPTRLLLEQEVVLPLAAEGDLDTALRWEMDRLTPFAAEQIFWSWVIDRRDRVRGRLHLRLRLVPKLAVADVLEALGAAGLAPALLASSSHPERVVPLIGTRRRPGGDRAAAAAGVVFACAVVAAVAAPFIRQEFAFQELDTRIAAMRQEVDAADALRRRLNERAASADIMAAEGARVGDAVRTLSAITEVLPDNTYLFGLGLRDRILTITGQSASAAKLIPAIAGDPAFLDPTFSAPVTRNEMTDAEAFSIRTEVRP